MSILIDINVNSSVSFLVASSDEVQQMAKNLLVQFTEIANLDCSWKLLLTCIINLLKQEGDI